MVFQPFPLFEVEGSLAKRFDANKIIGGFAKARKKYTKTYSIYTEIYYYIISFIVIGKVI